MKTILGITVFLFFIFIFLIAKKIEDHFSYIKTLNPNKYRNVGSFTDSRARMTPIGLNIGMTIFLPIFKNRNTEAEKENWKLKKLGDKIKVNCYLIRVVSLLLLLLIGYIFIIN